MFRRIFTLTVFVGLITAGLNYQAILDWWFLRNYEPSPAISALADRAALSQQGRNLFYVSDPRIEDKQSFNTNCPVVESSLVLGCYSNQLIYILQVQRSELQGVMEVTAVHEMLHAAYDRLSKSERQEVNSMLEAAFADVADKKIIDLVAEYESTGGSSVRENELHSILATQVAKLPTELETYFGKYFTDRAQVVGLYNKYETVFRNINQKIAAQKSKIKDLRTRLDGLEVQIISQRQQVDNLNTRLATLQNQNRNQEYNRLVPEQNQAVDRYNALVAEFKSVINQHNSKVDQVNDLVILQNDLVHSLDSSFESL